MQQSVRPRGAVGSPIIAGFADASLQAACDNIYVAYKTLEGQVSNLLIAKSRVSPLAGPTVPRSELQGMVILVRILLIVLKVAAFSPAWITLSSDSECCNAALARTEPILR